MRSLEDGFVVPVINRVALGQTIFQKLGKSFRPLLTQLAGVG